MPALGDALELLHTAHLRSKSVRAVLRQRLDHELWADSARLAPPGSTSISEWSPPGSTPGISESSYKVWHQRPGRLWRVEHDGAAGVGTTVMSEERWWRADPSGVHTNVRSDGTTAPVAVGLPDSYLEVAFDPYRLTAGLSILATTSARFCDRPALAIEAVSRPHPDGQCLAWPHADAHRFMVDARYGSLLRYEALLDGQCFMLWEMQEVAFDETLPAELFIGPAGARLGFASPELEEALASRIDDLTRLVEGQSAVPGRPEPIGFVRSKIKDRKHAPRQGNEGAPDAWLVLRPSLSEGLHGIRVGDELIVITWFHEARRDVLKLHPRDDLALPLTGVFATRSPDRPNPLGLHRVTVLDISDGRLHVEPIEAIDGTPVVDIKPVLQTSGDF